MHHPFYRIRQWAFSVVISILQNKETKLVFKRGAILDIPHILKQRELKSVCIVTTNGFMKRGTLTSLLEELTREGIQYSIFTNVTPDPTVESIEGGFRQYIVDSCDSIVAIGGGSVLDCAKIIAARVTNPKQPVYKMRGLLKIKHKLPPYIPVPATCGTGSEVTAAAVVTDTINGKHYKYAISDLKLIPELAILDANLLDTLPSSMLATTTMDALTHAIEAYTNCFATKKVEEDALEAIKLIFNNFEAAYTNRDKKALENLLLASTKAGIAFTHNYVGYVHALAHAMGALYGLPHGHLNAIVLTKVLKKYDFAIEKKAKRIISYTNVAQTGNSNVESLILEIEKCKKLAGLPDKIQELKENDYDEIIRRALLEANPTYPVPVIYGERELREILVDLTI